MAAIFMVLKSNGNVVLRQPVRIAKKSLVFHEAVDGKKEIAKSRCFYYTEEQGENYRRLRTIAARMRQLKKEQEDLKAVDARMKKFELERESLLAKFTKVTMKSTRF